MKGFALTLILVLATSCAHKKPVPTVDTGLSQAWPVLHIPEKPIKLASDEVVKAEEKVAPQNNSGSNKKLVAELKPEPIKIPKAKDARIVELTPDAPLIFDVPVSYNSKVQYWIEFFQTTGRSWYTKWLERSSRYLPTLQRTLKHEGLPQDLAYLAMIESGFSAHAASHAKAVGPWQFIRETGTRYGLKISWWLDERKDFQKSTIAAAKYLKKMHGMFNNWYLVAAGYNAGENRIKRAIAKHQTKNFWKIAQKDLVEETRDYVPKFIAALLIAKAPEMYGFRNIQYAEPLSFEHFRVPGGTNLNALAEAIGVTEQYMKELNPELVRGYVPNGVENHMIRIPKGSLQLVSHYVRKNFVSQR
ncbi:MAG: lytic transglycosylase domain-containing protein [Oligoflexia bacterium]|nr:lytic transglycosylase domain-containing protein [Oligoflexia bacterium]